MIAVPDPLLLLLEAIALVAVPAPSRAVEREHMRRNHARSARILGNFSVQP
jgi:hypothetical protein